MARAAIKTAKRSHVTKHEGFLRHADFRWLKIASVLSLASLAAFAALYAFGDLRPQPSGGTWLGYTLGTIGALLIVWLTLLGIRKRAITDGPLVAQGLDLGACLSRACR